MGLTGSQLFYLVLDQFLGTVPIVDFVQSEPKNNNIIIQAMQRFLPEGKNLVSRFKGKLKGTWKLPQCFVVVGFFLLHGRIISTSISVSAQYRRS